MEVLCLLHILGMESFAFEIIEIFMKVSLKSISRVINEIIFEQKVFWIRFKFPDKVFVDLDDLRLHVNSKEPWNTRSIQEKRFSLLSKKVSTCIMP